MSYQVIARKYRPQRFDDVTGQRHVSETLKNAIRSNRVAHGYIFSGARGVGKTTMARILARSLNCSRGPALEPCGECASCREIASGNSIDVLEIDAASNRGIDEIRDLREAVRYLPARDHYKIFIIDEVHMLTTEAFNALLKTLEEPPERSLFILATTEAHKLPATIQSRCQHFAFRLLDYSEIVSRLKEICAREGVEAGEGALGLIAQAGEGSLRDALSLLDQAIAACGTKITEQAVQQLLGLVPTTVLAGLVGEIQAGDSRRLLERVDELASSGQDLAAFATQLTRYVRNLMVAKSCGPSSPLLEVSDGERATLERLAATLTEEDLTRFFQALLRAQNEMRYALQPRLHLELTLVKLAHAPKLVPLEGLLAAIERESKGAGSDSGGGAGARPESRQRPTAIAGPPRSPSPPVRESPDSATPPWKRDESKPMAGLAPAVARETSTDSGAKSQPERRTPAVPPTAREHDQIAPPNLAREPRPEHGSTAPPGEDARLAAIKAVLFEQSKFLSTCLNPLTAWRFEGGHVHFVFSQEGAWAADLLQTREHQEKLSAACEKVLGQPVKIRVTLAVEERRPVAQRPSARERAERDSAVSALQKRFDCAVLDVKDLARE